MILLFDISSLAYRSFFTLGKLSSIRGAPTGVTHGFLTSVFSIITRLGYRRDCSCIFVEDGGSDFKRTLYLQYKMKRREKKASEVGVTDWTHYYQSLQILLQGLDALGATRVKVKGFEADDVIGHLAQKLDEKNIIVSSDKDFIQAVSSKTSFFRLLPKGTRLYDVKVVEREFGISPRNYGLAKAIAGCPEDEVPGIKGIGMKTAIRMVKESRESPLILRRILDLSDSEIPYPWTTTKNSWKKLFQNQGQFRLTYKLTSLGYGIENVKEDQIEFSRRRFSCSRFQKYSLKYDLKSLYNYVEEHSLFLRETMNREFDLSNTIFVKGKSLNV